MQEYCQHKIKQLEDLQEDYFLEDDLSLSTEHYDFGNIRMTTPLYPKKSFGICKKQPDHQTDQYFILRPAFTISGVAKFGLKNITTVG